MKEEMKNFTLSPEGAAFIKKELKRYETPLSAVLPALYRVQEESGGFVPPEAVPYLSELMKLPASAIYEALTFYTLFNKKPMGKHHIQVCCNVSCAMEGGRELLKNLKEDLKENKDCSLSPVECLGCCDKAPVVQINLDPYIEKASLEKIREKIQKK